MTEKVLQCGYMSGDTYTAAAYLALYPASRILLIKDTKDPQDKTEMIRSIYTECGVSSQVKVLDLSTTPTKVKELWTEIRTKYNDRAAAPRDVDVKNRLLPQPTDMEKRLSWLYYKEIPTNTWPRTITAVTGLVAEAFKSDSETAAARVAEKWKLGKLATAQKFSLYTFMAGKFKKVAFDINQNILVLWSRQSGKRGGAHLELDSSYDAIRQIVSYFADNPTVTILLAGDERGGKLASLAAGYSGVINISQMWKEPFWAENFANCSSLAQFAFFRLLAEDYNVVHLGMRSGMLESMALLGMKSYFMEPLNSPSGNRMVGFASAGIPYYRIQIGLPPGLTAKIAQEKIDRPGKGPPVLTKDAYEGNLEYTMRNLSRYGRFNKALGTWNGRTRRYEVSSDVLKEWAKFQMAGYNVDQALDENDNPDNYRGLFRDDFDLVVSTIEDAFV